MECKNPYCQHKNNADNEAGINIKNRVSVPVLRLNLLNQNEDGTFSPKPMNYKKVKEVLHQFREVYVQQVHSLENSVDVETSSRGDADSII